MDKKNETTIKVTVTIGGQSKVCEIQFTENEPREECWIATPIRTLQDIMGQKFLKWADRFFSIESKKNFNKELRIRDICTDYLLELEYHQDQKIVNRNEFYGKLINYCELKGYEYRNKQIGDIEYISIHEATKTTKTDQNQKAPELNDLNPKMNWNENEREKREVTINLSRTVV